MSRIPMMPVLLLVCLCSVVPSASGVVPVAAAASSSEASVVAETKLVTAAGKSFSVSLVRIDLLDPTLEVAPVVASGGIGHDEDFAAMVEGSHAAAAVNGTFFNSYEQDDTARYPNGLLAAGGAIVHSGVNQSLIVTNDKAALIRQVRAGVKIGVAHGGKTYPISPWGVNKYYGDDQTDQVVLYTRAFGPRVAFPTGINAVVDGGQIVRVTAEPVAIPEEGYVIFVGLSDNNKKYLLPRVHVGDAVTVTQLASAAGGAADAAAGESAGTIGSGTLDPREWLAAVGAGPRLVSGGAVDVDFTRDGFADPKITTQANRRSFVGVGADGRLVMGTVDGATVADLAEVALALGLTDAMNMDGGSSSALYANGVTLTKPGRRLSNILTVRKLEHPAVQIAINGMYRSDYRGVVLGETTMVPFRPLLESMQADFRWDDANRTLIVRKGVDELRLQPDVATVTLGAVSSKLEASPVIVDGHLYVPLRFVVETYGGSVIWDNRLYRVDVKLP